MSPDALKAAYLKALESKTPATSKEASRVLKTAQQLAKVQHSQLYLVGGAVRTLCQGQAALPDDLDLIICKPDETDTDGGAKAFSKALADKLSGHWVPLDESFGIYRVVVRDEADNSVSIDCSDALGNDLLTDLARRDLTINAIALDCQSGECFDPHHGLNDLGIADSERADSGASVPVIRPIIRMISAQNLLDDPLRMLRVFRFAAQLSANAETPCIITPETLEVIKAHGHTLWQSAPERIHLEFLRLLSAPYAFATLQVMAQSGLLEVLIPELTACRSVLPNQHHHLGLFEHTLELVRQTELLLPLFCPEAQQHLNSFFKPYIRRTGLVKMACLLHDIGKPETMSVVSDQKTTFYGHDVLSESMTDALCKRWRLSKDISDYLKKLVRWHLYPSQFGMQSPRRSILKFFRRIGDETPDLLLHSLADRYSTQGPSITPQILAETRQNHLGLCQQFFAEQAVLHAPVLLTGRQIMEALDLVPGPAVGKAVEALKEAQQLGQVTSADEAMTWLRQLDMVSTGCNEVEKI